MKLQLTEETVLNVLGLGKFKDDTMKALEVLKAEVAETKTLITGLLAAFAGLQTQLSVVSAKLNDVVTPEDVAAVKAELDAAQDLITTALAPKPTPVEPAV